MNPKELRKIINELGENGKELIADKLNVTVRAIDYWLNGDVVIREINAMALRAMIEKERQSRRKFVVPLKN